jgi:hypothetical protein
MKVEFHLHGLDQIVEGQLDIQDAPMPQIGWELSFDAVGQVRVTGIEGYYVALGEHEVRLDLALPPSVRPEWSAAEVVEFFRTNGELTAFSEVSLGDYWCRCPRCKHR